ncbi:hypothetical protein KI387_007881, partial [Taxus chinensis]
MKLQKALRRYAQVFQGRLADAIEALVDDMHRCSKDQNFTECKLSNCLDQGEQCAPAASTPSSNQVYQKKLKEVKKEPVESDPQRKQAELPMGP